MDTRVGLSVILGTGPLGLAVARHLSSQGRPFRVVSRAADTSLPAGAELMAADVSEPADATRACAGAAVVYHCANPPYHLWPKLHPPLMAAIIEGASAARVEGRVRAAIGRGSDFFGPHARQSLVGDGVFGRALAGKPGQSLGNPDVPRTVTYIDDFGRALVTLGEPADALDEVWHVPNASAVPLRLFVEMVFAVIGRLPRIQGAPRPILLLLAMFNRVLRAVVEQLYQSDRPWIVDSSKFERAFEWEATPLEESILPTVAWFKEHTNR